MVTWLKIFEPNVSTKKLCQMVLSQVTGNHFYEPIVKSVVEKLVSGGPSGSPPQSNQVEETRTKRSVLILQYRGKISDRLAKRIRQGSNVSVIFTTRKQIMLTIIEGTDGGRFKESRCL